MSVNIGMIVDIIAKEFKDIERKDKPTEKETQIAESIIESLKLHANNSAHKYNFNFSDPIYLTLHGASKPEEAGPAKKRARIESDAVVDDVFKSIAAKQKQTKWECKDCLAQNDQVQNKCACCGAVNPNASANTNAASKTEAPKPTFSFGTLPSSIAAKNVEQTKSLFSFGNNSMGAPKTSFSFGTGASTGPTAPSNTEKPTNDKAKEPVEKPTSTADDVFKAIAKNQKSSQWECSSCLTRNPNEKAKCACCGTAKF